MKFKRIITACGGVMLVEFECARCARVVERILPTNTDLDKYRIKCKDCKI